MKIKTLLCVIFCSWIGLVEAEEKLELRSVLLQILNKVKTDAQAGTLTGIGLVTSPNEKSSDRDNEIPEQFSSNYDASDELDNDQKGIIKEAIEEINADISKLKAKYIIELDNIAYNETDYIVQNSENDDNRVHKHSEKDKEQEYDSLIRKMNDAAKNLLLMRIKLATDFGITDDDMRLYSNEASKITKTQNEKLSLKESAAHLLMKIFADIESDKENDAEVLQENGQKLEQTEDELKLILLNALKKGNQNVLTKTGNNGNIKTRLDSPDQQVGGDFMETSLQDRNYHSKHCSGFTRPCGGWSPMCCELGVVKKKKIRLCCSFIKGSMKSIDDLSGICLPNPFGNQECAN
ncbi:uncharacterized protein LOC123540607 [Mercenaria mercenaria]|uniref:uncharacterized protein LOC123540607 n=1 Tax=Mercenaria mercenaria TaxID=6596 RepID=UPI00234F1C64|nr:uncharacterized protein LOC123540607 [Mercenaria mercenaria]